MVIIFSKPNMTLSNVLFCLSPEFFSLQMTDEERSKKIFTVKKLESEKLGMHDKITESYLLLAVDTDCIFEISYAPLRVNRLSGTGKEG